MIALSTTEPVRFSPPWLAGQDGAPVFLIRAGSVVDRAQIEALLAGPPYDAGRVFPWHLADAAADAARSLLDGADLAQVLEALTAMKSAMSIDKLPTEQRQLLVGIDSALAAAWPEYAELRRRDARRDEFMPLLAAQRFLVGWENFAAPFVTGKDGRPTDDTLRQLGQFFLPLVGHEAYRLLYAEQQRPLSSPPVKSAPTRPVSPAVARRRTAAKAGSSTASSGKKTRA